MAVKFESVKAGDVLYDVRSVRMGNTMMRTVRVWHVQVLEIHPDHAVVKWNSNPPRRYSPREIKRLRRKKPELVHNICGAARIKLRGK